VLLDVMDHGVPIVASDVDGIPDLIVDEQSGVLVPPDDALALARAIAALLDDPARRRHLADSAHQRLEYFSPDAMAEAYLNLYRRCLVTTPPKESTS
jgi:glycosyltransferase involved in cell wall biosynthesis